MKATLNKMYVGLVSGVLAPALVFIVIYLVKYAGEYSLKVIVEQIQSLDLGAKIIALSVFLSNLILFYVMYRIRWDKFCRGVLLATFLYAFLVVSMKF